jgi:murein L,D-transpeptidase YafK
MIEQNLGEREGGMGRRASEIARRWVVLTLLAGACARPAAVPPPAPPPAPRPELEAPLPCQRIVAIQVSKRDRRLRAHCEGGAVVELPVALGRETDGPKTGSGDSRTPEGRYQISGTPQASRFHLFVPIDYPSIADAEIARNEGRLSEDEYHRIVDAHAQGRQPPADTALGGHLGFHGEGRRWRGDSRYLDWTYGCIALSDADVDFVAARSAIGTPVWIEP